MLRGQGTEKGKLGRSNKGKAWLKALEWVSSSLAGVDHVFVKLLRNPPLFSDIDILIPDKKEREKALEALGGRERFDKGAFLEGHGRFIRKLGRTDLDIYPDACWGGFKVADGSEIVKRGINRERFGIELKLPKPDDDFYLIATHAYSHLNIRWVELENCGRLAVDPLFDPKRIEELATRYGTEPAIEFFSHALNRRAGTEIPKWFILRNSPNHIRKLSGKTSLRQFISDVAWHFVRPMTKFFGIR